MQFNTITASLVLLFCNALTANAAPLPTTADLAVRDVQAPRSIEWEMTKRANPASNHGGTTGAGAPGGVFILYPIHLSSITNDSRLPQLEPTTQRPPTMEEPLALAHQQE